MKATKKIITSGIILSLIMAMAMLFAGCGSSPETLEEYINSDSEAQETIDSLSSDGMNVDVKGNVVTFTYTYDQTFDEDTIAAMKPEMESAMNSMESTFTGVASDLEEGSGITGVTVKVIYKDSAGTEIYSNEYTK